jgi:hypothetical protein
VTEWQKVYEEREGTLVVRVTRRGDYRPQYSIQVGREWRDADGTVDPERLSSFIRISTDNGGVDRALEGVLTRALDWIQTDVTATSARASSGGAGGGGGWTPDPGSSGRRGRNGGRRGRDRRDRDDD